MHRAFDDLIRIDLFLKADEFDILFSGDVKKFTTIGGVHIKLIGKGSYNRAFLIKFPYPDQKEYVFKIQHKLTITDNPYRSARILRDIHLQSSDKRKLSPGLLYVYVENTQYPVICYLSRYVPHDSHEFFLGQDFDSFNKKLNDSLSRVVLDPHSSNIVFDKYIQKVDLIDPGLCYHKRRFSMGSEEIFLDRNESIHWLNSYIQDARYNEYTIQPRYSKLETLKSIKDKFQESITSSDSIDLISYLMSFSLQILEDLYDNKNTFNIDKEVDHIFNLFLELFEKKLVSNLYHQIFESHLVAILNQLKQTLFDFENTSNPQQRYAIAIYIIYLIEVAQELAILALEKRFDQVPKVHDPLILIKVNISSTQFFLRKIYFQISSNKLNLALRTLEDLKNKISHEFKEESEIYTLNQDKIFEAIENSLKLITQNKLSSIMTSDNSLKDFAKEVVKCTYEPLRKYYKETTIRTAKLEEIKKKEEQNYLQEKITTYSELVSLLIEGHSELLELLKPSPKPADIRAQEKVINWKNNFNSLYLNTRDDDSFEENKTSLDLILKRVQSENLSEFRTIHYHLQNISKVFEKKKSEFSSSSSSSVMRIKK